MKDEIKKKTSKTGRLIAWIPFAAVIILVFVFSSQPGARSKATSMLISSKVYLLSTGDSASNGRVPEIFDYWTRVVLHMFEYAALSFFTGIVVSVNGFRGKLRFLYMFFAGAFIAFADEFFQIFVYDRYGDIGDFTADCVSVIMMAAVFYICGGWLDKKRKKKDGTGKSKQEGRRPFMNFMIDDISFDTAIDRIMEMAGEGKHYIVTPNADHIVKLQKDEQFLKIYEKADLVTADGMPLLWIADSLGNSLTEKISGADIMPAVCERAAKEKKSVFLLGGREGVAEKAAANLKKKYKGLIIAGTYAPPMGFDEELCEEDEVEPEESDVEKAVRAVNKASPDILVVCMGAPKQEKFIAKHMDEMNFHVALPVGAAIDFAAGEYKRAPLWMRNAGLEWFYRFFQEPGRLFKRYFIDDMKIFILAWKYKDVMR